MSLSFQSTRPVWGATTFDVVLASHILFQSTRPVWGATVTCCANHPIITLFQSTRPVWGATLKRRLLDGRTFISIHAPRVGRDPEAAAAHKDEQISIHAPRVGRDHGNEYGVREYPISIHAPRVGRDDKPVVLSGKIILFQSTRPVWGATCQQIKVFFVYIISIHAPRVGRDVT